VACRQPKSRCRSAPHTRKPSNADIGTLVPREVEALHLLSKGYLYKEMGDQLGISTHTVNTHIRRIYEKLHVQSRGQAVAKYRGLAEQG
jgi:DNA-binding CsgD family transcriptional regulator